MSAQVLSRCQTRKEGRREVAQQERARMADEGQKTRCALEKPRSFRCALEKPRSFWSEVFTGLSSRIVCACLSLVAV